MPESARRDNDLVLDPTQYAYILDATKGGVVCYVGPARISLAETDKPVKFVDGKFERRSSIDGAIQSFPVASEGDYIVLENPAKNDEKLKVGMANSNVDLRVGRKINIPGPASFPLWPGQTAKVIEGHHLRSNQYLVAVVYNEDEAKKNWGSAVMKSQEPVPEAPKGTEGGEDDESGEGDKPLPTSPPVPVLDKSAEEVKAKLGKLTTGKRIVIKGTEISFFMPPTGVEVVPEQGHYVRDAVTLETLEYSILVSEGGKKRYVRGPDVVFPEPTEVFVRRDIGYGDKKSVTRKFRAVELNELSGIYVQVIAGYEDTECPLPNVNGEKQTRWKEGDELWITGESLRIYFPRPEHGIIRYAGQKSEKMYAVAIPAGEARYVLNRLTGAVETVEGPKMFLPDPRTQVIVRRVLQPHVVDLWFPGNAEAAEHNKKLAEVAVQEMTSGHVSEDFLRAMSKGGTKGRSAYKSRQGVMNMIPTEEEDPASSVMSFAAASSSAEHSYGAGYLPAEEAHSAVADEVKRKQGHTPPRTVVLNTKYEGAVLVDVWQGYAVQVKSKTGEREVVVGPKPRLLDYEEGLDVLTLSTGTPKSDKKRIKTAYLQVRNNRVSDAISAETADLVDVEIGLAYRVNFEGESAKWFEVEDYVRLLCEHARSMLRNHMKKVKVEELMADNVAMVRDMILGKADEKGERSGLSFEENGMVVTDVEVLSVTIGDDNIATMLVQGQHTAVRQAIELKLKAGELERQQKLQQIERDVASEVSKTSTHQMELEQEETAKQQEATMLSLDNQLKQQESKLRVETALQTVNDETSKGELERHKAKLQLELEHRKGEVDMDLQATEKRGEILVKKIAAITPDLIAAMQVHGDKVITSEMIKELGAVAALTGDSIDGVFKKLLEGSVLSDVFSGNGGGMKGLAAGAVARSGLGARRGSQSAQE